MVFLKHRLLIWCKMQGKDAQLKMEVLVHASLEFQHQPHMNTCSVLSVPPLSLHLMTLSITFDLASH
jgi:hypothetical protein